MINNDSYVVMKLISGETIIGTYDGEDDDFIKINFPIKIKKIRMNGATKEQITAAPFCAFSDSSLFVLEKSHVLYIKRLSESFIPYYLNFVQVYDEAKVPVTKGETGYQSSSSNLSHEEIQERLNGINTVEDDNNVRVTLKGNETKH